MICSEVAQNGIGLEAFSAENADLVLSWRNAEPVRSNSLNAEIIGKEAHLDFVKALAKKTDVGFFVVTINGCPEAVLNVDASAGDSAHWGCYLAPAQAPKPGIFPLLILISAQLAFAYYGVDRLLSDVLAQNAPPQKINAFLGVPITGGRAVTRASGDVVEVVEYALHRGAFDDVKSRAGKLLTKGYRAMFETFADNLDPSPA